MFYYQYYQTMKERRMCNPLINRSKKCALQPQELSSQSLF